jgi:hypothetical protein
MEKWMIDGLGDFARKLRELGEATTALNGDITELRVDPHDPASIESAIRQMEMAIDERVSSYAHNDLVSGISEELKEIQDGHS